MSEKEIFFVAEESDEGGFEARALGYSIFTEGETMEELKKNILDAVKCHFEEGKGPALIRLHFIREELLPI